MGGPGRTVGWAGLLQALLTLGAGCGAPPPGAPSAVIEADPLAVCEGDGFRTPIRLDASASQPRLTLVPVPPDPEAPPLRFDWALAGAAHHVVGGSPTGPELTVTTSGARPLHVTLTVRDAEGGEATALETVAITARDPARGICTEGGAP